MILTNKSLIKLKNVAQDPYNSFEFSEEDLKLLEEDSVFGTFHTHPGKDANLSVSDYLAFKNYPRLSHYICGNNGTKCYVVQGGILVEKS